MHLPIDKWGTLWKPTLREKILTGNEMQYYKRTITIKVVNLITSTHIICFFVCTFFLSHLRIFHSYEALMAIEQWGFFRRVPHLLWHRTSVYNGHLWWPVILPPVAKHLAVELTTPVLTTSACHDQESKPDLPHARRKLYLWDTEAVLHNVYNLSSSILNFGWIITVKPI